MGAGWRVRVWLVTTLAPVRLLAYAAVASHLALCTSGFQTILRRGPNCKKKLYTLADIKSYRFLRLLQDILVYLLDNSSRQRWGIIYMSTAAHFQTPL